MTAGSSSSPAARVVRNVLSNWGAFAVTAIIGFFLSPFIVKHLGESGYGTWVLLNSTVGYLGLLDLGVRSAVMRYVARYHAAGDHGNASQLVQSALTVFGVIALLAVLAGLVLATVVGRVFQLPPELVGEARLVAVLGALSIALSLVTGVFGGIMVGLQRFDAIGVADASIELLRALGTIVVLTAGGGLVGLSLVQLGVSLIRLALQYRMSKSLYPELTLTGSRTSVDGVRQILTFGLTSSALHVTAQIVMYADSIIIGVLLPVEFVAYFAIGATLTHYARSMGMGISSLLAPLASASQAVGDLDKVKRSLLASTRLTTAAILPVAVTFFVRGDSFIGLWMGPQFAELSGRILAILAIVVAVHAGHQVITSTMIGLDRHKGLIPVTAGDAIGNATLSIILVKTMGVVGSAIGTLIPQLIVTLLVYPWYVRRELGLRMRDYWLNTHLRPLLSVIPFTLATIAIDRVWTARTVAEFFLQVLIVLPVALVGQWIIALNPAERAMARGLVAAKRHARLS